MDFEGGLDDHLLLNSAFEQGEILVLGEALHSVELLLSNLKLLVSYHQGLSSVTPFDDPCVTFEFGGRLGVRLDIDLSTEFLLLGVLLFSTVGISPADDIGDRALLGSLDTKLVIEDDVWLHLILIFVESDRLHSNAVV